MNRRVPRVSIGLTVYNSERYLVEGLESLLDQRFGDFEVLICDNASTDGTEAICLEYAAKDDRIRYVRNRVNGGFAANFNQAFRLSSGEFFKWAAYDDVCGPHLLSRCVEVLDRDPSVVLVYPRVAMIDESGQTTNRIGPGLDLSSREPANRFSTVMRSKWGAPMFGVIRSSVLARTGLMRSTAGCDHILLAELCLRGRCVQVPHYDFFNREHPDREVTRSSITQVALYADPRLPRAASRLRAIQAVAYLDAIRAAPIGPRARGRCFVAVGRWLGGRIGARAYALLR
jgi:glycosyltransferase involved in cell wall biosynthesis